MTQTNDRPTKDVLLVAPEEPSSELGIPDVDAETRVALAQQAAEYVNTLADLSVHSPAFVSRIKRIENLGNADMIRIAGGSKRLLDRSMAGSSSNQNAQQHVSAALGDLRSIVEELAPSPRNLSQRGFMGIFPSRKPLDNYFARYDQAQDSLNTVVKSLLRGKDELLQDNAALEQERQDLYVIMSNLNEFAALVDILEEEVIAKTAKLRAMGKMEQADMLNSEVLFAVRQKRLDIHTRLSVGAQSYLAFNIVRRNNVELAKGVDRARITTITALRTAILVAQSLTNQKQLLDDMDAIRSTADSAILKTSSAMRNDKVALQRGDADRDKAIAELKEAFAEVSATLAKVEENKEMAETELGQTMSVISAEDKDKDIKLVNLSFTSEEGSKK